MKAKVLGIQDVDYISRKTGNPVVGVMLHVCFKDSQVIGEATDNVFVSDNLGLRRTLDSMNPGCFVDVVYNRRGSVADIILLEDASQKSGK